MHEGEMNYFTKKGDYGDDGDHVVQELIGLELSFLMPNTAVTDPNWKQAAIMIGKRYIAQQKAKDEAQQAEIDKTSLPSNVINFLKKASSSGINIKIK